MDNIKISIILPVFNEEKYIQTTLDSIFNQDFKDFEVIVIDDGSTDDTLKIVEEKFKNFLNLELLPNTIKLKRYSSNSSFIFTI